MASSESLAEDAPKPVLHQVQRSWSPYSLTSPGVRAWLRRWWSGAGFNHDVASKLRYETDMTILRMRCALSVGYKRQTRELASRTGLLIHLGCGNALLQGWINLDCYPPPRVPETEILTLDMRRGLPFARESVAAVFSEHFLEHLPFDTVRSRVLPEIRRILAPGATVRIGVPNGEYFVDQYLAYRSGRRDELFEEQRAGKTPMMMLNEIAHSYGHYFVYDFDTMAQILGQAGFVNVMRRQPLETSIPYFKGKDRVDPWRNAMTLYVEAEAPSAA